MKPKPQRINLSTPPEDIVATMAMELKHVLYQKRKAYGGKRKYEAWKRELQNKALTEKKNQISDLTDYISPVGNRWVMYSSMEYFAKSGHVLPTHAAFIYYETYGSCGAFFPLFPEGERTPNGVMIFTSHFFLRMCERTKVEFRSKAMIQEFITTNFLRTSSGRDEEGAESVVRFRNGYGLGKTISVIPYVIEIRTFLADEELSPSQRKRLKTPDLHGQIMGCLGWAATTETLQVVKQITHFFSVLAQLWEGFDPKQYTSAELMMMAAKQMSPNFFDPYMGGGTMTWSETEQFADDLVAVIVRVAENLGYKGWTTERVRQGIADVIVSRKMNNKP